jgi:hypothetical protein
MIELKNKILEKPKDKNELKEWFKLYSNNKMIDFIYK